MRNITLPLLAEASKKYKFLHIIQYSESLPVKYVEDLKQLEKQYSFLKINEHSENGKPEIHINEIIMDYFFLKSIQEDVWIGKFILDDDDCISLNYFRVMTQYVNPCYEGFYVSLGLGMLGVHDENYNLIHYADIYKPKINIGFMNVGRYSHQHKNLYFTTKSTSHMSMDKVNRVILDSREISFYWSRHQHQDTRVNNDQKKIDRTMEILMSMPIGDVEKINENFGANFLKKLKSFDSDGNFNLI